TSPTVLGRTLVLLLIVMRKFFQATPVLAATLILYAPSNSTAANDILNPRPILFEARAAAQPIPDANERDLILFDIAQAQISAHDPDAALDTLDRCQECPNQSFLLASVARELAAVGRTEQALDLVKIIQRDRTKTEIPDGPTYTHGESNATIALSDI